MSSWQNSTVVISPTQEFRSSPCLTAKCYPQFWLHCAVTAQSFTHDYLDGKEVNLKSITRPYTSSDLILLAIL